MEAPSELHSNSETCKSQITMKQEGKNASIILNSLDFHIMTFSYFVITFLLIFFYTFFMFSSHDKKNI